jgi:Zn-dependent oligopeptidase
LYSKDQASQLKQAFWTTFGQYMALQPSAEGQRINWINYKTGIKHLFFKMQADNRSGYIAIEMAHPDRGIQELIFEQFASYRKILEDQVQESWHWDLHAVDEYGKTISRIWMPIADVSVFKKDDWPKLISFFKPRIIALDEFWNDAQYGFELFR